MKRLHTIEDVAQHFGLKPDQVVRRCRAQLGGWPHIRPDETKSSTWRFSDDDIEAIETRLARRSEAIDSWGRSGRRRSA